MTQRRTFEVTHTSGLHARASTKFVEVAQSHKSEVQVQRGPGDDGAPWANGCSVIEILTLGIEVGDQITVQVVGPDEEKTMAALAELIEADFHGV